MPIIVCGISHKTAPIALREQVIFSMDKISLYLNDLLVNENVREAVLFSTCNRSELYCDADNVLQIVDWFCRQHAVSKDILESVLYVYTDQAAVRHMMEVACGLDSMVMGEPQILGQMKEAFSESCAAGSVDSLFNRLFQQVFTTAKEIRTNTAIGACPVSISSSAVSLIKHYYPQSLNASTVLLLGAGDTIRLVLRYLEALSPQRIIIVNRNTENARAIVEDSSAEIFSFTQLSEALHDADILISATGSVQPIVTQSMLSQRSKPINIIDIAVPRDVESSAGDLPHVHLHSIDDLKNIIQKNRHGREHAAEKAFEMIVTRSHEFMNWLASLEQVATTISAYRNQVEALCQAELIKYRRYLLRGDDPAEVLTNFAYSLTNKLLHHPSVQLRQAGFEGRFDFLQFAKQLFAIPETTSELL